MGATNYTTNSDMLTLLALRVKEYRLAARMSQKELAEQSGVSQTTISHFEQGVSRNLTLANFISLLRALGQAERLAEILPELPMPPMALREIETFYHFLPLLTRLGISFSISRSAIGGMGSSGRISASRCS